MKGLDWPDSEGFWWCRPIWEKFFVEVVKVERRGEKLLIRLGSGRFTDCYPDCEFIPVGERCPWDE